MRTSMRIRCLSLVACCAVVLTIAGIAAGCGSGGEEDETDATTCTPGGLRCPCRDDGTCVRDLRCLSGVCVAFDGGRNRRSSGDVDASSDEPVDVGDDVDDGDTSAGVDSSASDTTVRADTDTADSDVASTDVADGSAVDVDGADSAAADSTAVDGGGADADGGDSGPAADTGADTDDLDTAGSCEVGGVDTCGGGDSGPCADVQDADTRTTFYRDQDGDGYGATGSSVSRCRRPSGYVEQGGDCDDSDPNNWNSCASCTDADGDGYYTGCDAYVTIDEDCDDADVNNWNSCSLCSDADGDGYYTNCDAYQTIDGPDCHDSNGDVHPGQTSFFASSYTEPSGSFSYDYNCDGTEEKRWTDQSRCNVYGANCSRHTGGWDSSSTPSCGGFGYWVTGCTFGTHSCYVSGTTSRTQECR